MEEFTQRLQYLFAGILIVVGFILLSLLLVAAQGILSGEPTQSKKGYYRANTSNAGSLGTPNVVAASMTQMVSGSAKAMSSVGDTFVGAFRSVTSTTVRVAGSAVNGVAKGAVFVAQIPGKTYGALMTPSASAQVPVIVPYPSPVLTVNTAPATIVLASTAQQPVVAQEVGQESAWPINGKITTLFGVPHRPYQTTHTGMDISSGLPSGITQIKPFLSGRVIDVVRSSYGLGNHVIVDHGGGMTSVYAHMYSIAVQNGQEVNMNTTLGLEGSTGVSTGTHLHFEIRLNGVPTNPEEYVGGHP